MIIGDVVVEKNSTGIVKMTVFDIIEDQFYHHGHFTKHGEWVDKDGNQTAIATYMIDWSSSMQKYRLRMNGKNPQNHTTYSEALSKLSELNNKLLNDPQIERDNKLKN